MVEFRSIAEEERDAPATAHDGRPRTTLRIGFPATQAPATRCRPRAAVRLPDDEDVPRP